MDETGSKRAPLSDGRRLRGEQTRRRVLDFAVTIANAEGLEGLTFGKVAAAAAAPKSTLQVLFKDREGLQLQTLEAGADVFAAGIRARLKGDVGPFGRLRDLCEAWFDLVSDTALPGGCLVTAATTEYRARPGAIRALIEVHRGRWRDHLRQAARAAQEAGELRPEIDLEQLVFQILAFQAAANFSLDEGACEDFARARRGVEALLAQARAPS